jgi:Dolichyl-phosphate-mannose-protein mannosyltransferase
MPSARTRRRRPPRPWVVLAGIVGVSTIARGVVGTLVPTPWIEPDEVVYAELGRSLWSSGHLTILGAPTPFYSLVYPALVGGPLSLHDTALGYALLKWLQALVMSTAAVPVYLWGRSFAGRRWALAAAGLTVAVPGLAYSGLLMSEVAFYPLMVLVAWTWARALERPTIGRQLLAVATIALALLTRVQALVLLPALPTAIGLLLVFQRSREVRRYSAMLVGACLIGLGWAAWQISGTGAPTEALGAYRAAGESPYDVRSAARFVLYHAADVLLLTGIIPACAVALLVVDAFRGREARRDMQAALAVTCAVSTWFVLEVGVFASRHVGFLAERNLFALGPLFFLGLAAWLQQGGPRRGAPRFLVAAAALLLLVALPVRTLATQASLPNTFGLIPLYRIHHALPRADSRLLLVDAVVAALAVLLVTPRRRLWSIPTALMVAFVGVSIVASTTMISEARAVDSKLLGSGNRDWIDDHADGPVAYVYTGEAYWNAIYENRFWSRRIETVYTLPGPPVPGPVRTAPVGPLADGRIIFASGRPAPARRVVASDTVAFFGNERVHIRRSSLALWSIDPPLRLSTWLIGMGFFTTSGDAKGDLTATGDISSGAHLVIYACSRGLLKLSLEADYVIVVKIFENGRRIRRVRLIPGGGWSDDLELRPAQNANRHRVPQCSFDIVSTGLVHVPRFELVRT